MNKKELIYAIIVIVGFLCVLGNYPVLGLLLIIGPTILDDIITYMILTKE